MKRSVLRVPFFSITKQYASYIFLSFFYFLGLVLGSVAKNFIGNQTEIELFESFVFVSTASREYGFFRIFITSAVTELFFYITVFVFGLSIVGIPVICFVMFYKGFGAGFFIAFVSSVYGVQGLIAIIIAVLPGLFMSVTLLLLFCNRAMEASFALASIKSKGERVRYERPSFSSLYRTGLLLYLISLTGILYETLVCPLVISLISN